MTISLAENPKYNGPHACPACGTKSHWTCINESPITIRVECEGHCGTYLKTYSELRSERFFEKHIEKTTA